MKYIALLVSAILLSTLSFGKGHGGGHGGGHGHGGHSGGHGHGGHSGGHGGGHSSSGHAGGRAAAAGKSSGGARGSLGTSRNANARVSPALVLNNKSISAYKSYPAARNSVGEAIPSGHPFYRGYYGEYAPYYYYPAYGPYYNPFAYNPYYSMFYFGAGIVYTPHYNYNDVANNDNTSQNLQKMDGYVVYAHDTIGGLMTLTKSAVFIENIDSGKHYDYKFRFKQQELEFVSVYNNTDSSQLCMTRVKEDPKKMWRIVHEGRLNVYDRRYGFIYRPQDIDVESVMVSYNGVTDAIGSSSVARTKLHLIAYINKAYNLDLNPNNFTWKEILIYLDKLD